MSGNVLYFPYIRVPNNEWFTRVLLYWEHVGAIVPATYQRDVGALGQHMLELVQVGLVREIAPEHHLHNVPRFCDAFIEYVDSPDYPIKPRSVDLATVPIARIHSDKMIYSIADKLVDRGLARRASTGWFNVEKYTAAQFMAYLASVLSRVEGLDYVPITDETVALQALAEPLRTVSSNRVIDRLRVDVLANILPAPAGGIRAEDLAKFKSDNSHQLRRFRRRVEAFLLDLSSIPDANTRDARSRLFVEQMQDDINEIKETLQASGWTRISQGSFLALAVSLLTVAATAATSGLFPAVVAALGIVPPVRQVVDERRTRHDSMLNEYAAYAALAQRRLGGRSSRTTR